MSVILTYSNLRNAFSTHGARGIHKGTKIPKNTVFASLIAQNLKLSFKTHETSFYAIKHSNTHAHAKTMAKRNAFIQYLKIHTIYNIENHLPNTKHENMKTSCIITTRSKVQQLWASCFPKLQLTPTPLLHETTQKKATQARLKPIAHQNKPHHYEAQRRLTRPPCPYHDPGNLREGEREYDDSVNGHPSCLPSLWGTARGAPQPSKTMLNNQMQFQH